MLTATLLLVGVVLVAMCLAERHVTRLPLSPATVYLVVGWAAGEMVRAHMRVPPTSPQHADMLVILTEGALLISLFAVGLRLRVPRTVRGWRIAVTLASGAMLATIALAGTVAVFLLPELGLGGALLLASVLAPTDPVLASEVQIRSPTDRDALRVSLTAEGGLNDATASPLVLLGLGLLLVPAQYALNYTITEAHRTFTLTGIAIAVGVFGGYAAVIAVYLGIAGFSPRRSTPVVEPAQVAAANPDSEDPA